MMLSSPWVLTKGRSRTKKCAVFGRLTVSADFSVTFAGRMKTLRSIVLISLLSLSTTLVSAHVCNDEIYCTGTLLATVQMSRIFNDSKTFVDRPTSKPVAEVMAAFNKLGKNPTREAVRTFVEDNFLNEGNTTFTTHQTHSCFIAHFVLTAGAEIYPVLPTDWVEKPDGFLSKCQDPSLAQFGASIHRKWRSLTRQFNTSAVCPGCGASSLMVKRPFVVPGGRCVQ